MANGVLVGDSLLMGDGGLLVGLPEDWETDSRVSGGAVGGGELPPANWDEIQANPLARECLVPMGMTAENVAERYGVTRAEQDAMAVDSHTKALAAQAQGKFDAETVPVETRAVGGDGTERAVVVRRDEGPREGTSLES